jgi:hypothetical protein
VLESKSSQKRKMLQQMDEYADVDMGEEEERKGRHEIIPSSFANSRNFQDKSMLSYNQAVKNNQTIATH